VALPLKVSSMVVSDDMNAGARTKMQTVSGGLWRDVNDEEEDDFAGSCK